MKSWINVRKDYRYKRIDYTYKHSVYMHTYTHTRVYLSADCKVHKLIIRLKPYIMFVNSLEHSFILCRKYWVFMNMFEPDVRTVCLQSSSAFQPFNSMEPMVSGNLDIWGNCHFEHWNDFFLTCALQSFLLWKKCNEMVCLLSGLLWLCR